jgi:4-hydroxy-tetrahydrodipicolinate synthase
MEGVWSALPTPFTTEGEVDECALKALVRWQLSQGVRGVVAYGTTGESPTLSHADKERVTRATIEAAEGAPVMVGVGTNCTRTSVEFARQARAWGASAGLVVTPYYNKPTQEGLERHFSAIAEAVEGWPLTLYVVPGRAVISLDVEVAARLVERYPHIVAIKDASAEMVYGRALMRQMSASILSGDDPTLLPHALMGGSGAISVLSNLCPAEVSALWRAVKAGCFDEARALASLLEPLAEALFIESNPTPLKAALAWRFSREAREGLSVSEEDREALARLTPNVRLPLTPLSERGERVLREAWERFIEARQAYQEQMERS